MIASVLTCGWLLGAAPATQPGQVCAAGAPTPQAERIIAAAESYLGQPYVFGGRAGRPGCRAGRKRVRCLDGIDCQSLIFFSYERVLGRPWTRFSVTPSISLARGELGQPVPGLDGVLRDEVDRSQLRRGDVLFFLLDGYNLDADQPLLVRGEAKYGTWHTGLVHCVAPRPPADAASGPASADVEVTVIHAKPGDQVTIEPLDAIPFDALVALRLGALKDAPRSSRTRPASSLPATAPATTPPTTPTTP